MNGEAKIEATPDQYNFYPYYEVKDTTASDATQKLTQKANEVVAKLKELGVKEEQIKVTQNTNTSYDMMSYPVREQQSTVSFTIKVGDKAIAQKVQDYLQSTDAKGTLTPQADFADATRKKYESELREKALADAKEKATQSAKALGSSLGKVVTIVDNQSGSIFPMYAEGYATDAKASSTMPILTGQNELRYSVQVTYALK